MEATSEGRLSAGYRMPHSPEAFDHKAWMPAHRQRGEIRQLQRAGISTASAEALLERMLTKIDGICVERDKLEKEVGPTNQPKGMSLAAGAGLDGGNKMVRNTSAGRATHHSGNWNVVPLQVMRHTTLQATSAHDTVDGAA